MQILLTSTLLVLAAARVTPPQSQAALITEARSSTSGRSPQFWLRSKGAAPPKCHEKKVVNSNSDKFLACPKECPVYADDRGDDTDCNFECVEATPKACTAVNKFEPIPDPKMGICRACIIYGCAECMTDGTDTCARCESGFSLNAKGTCDNKNRYYWYALFAVLGLVALFIVAWMALTAFLPAPPPARGPLEALQPAVAAVAGLGFAASAQAQSAALDMRDLSPETFKPVCPASDGLYGLGKAFADGLLGAEGAEYRPLAIEALLRVRLEVCVLESFVYEAIIPFVERKGIGWVLPLHETIDTVIAGTVFAVALNFILFGTTKILSVLGIYHDILIGTPLRLIGFAILPEKRPKETPLIQINWPGMPPPKAEEEPEEPGEPPSAPFAIFGGICKGYGIFAGILKDFLEGVDTFAGRYLAFFSILYVAFKWAHFKLFNDFPPF